MYPSGIGVNTTHDLHQYFSSGYFHSQKISNGIVTFAGCVKGRSPNEKRAIALIILCLFGVAVHWSSKTQTATVAHYSHSTWPQKWSIPKNLGFQVSDDPTPIYEDIQPKIDVINSKRLIIRVKHIDVPIHYVHDQYVLLNIDPFKSKTIIQPTDIEPKISTGPLLKRHYSYI